MSPKIAMHNYKLCFKKTLADSNLRGDRREPQQLVRSARTISTCGRVPCRTGAICLRATTQCPRPDWQLALDVEDDLVLDEGGQDDEVFLDE